MEPITAIFVGGPSDGKRLQIQNFRHTLEIDFLEHLSNTRRTTTYHHVHLPYKIDEKRAGIFPKVHLYVHEDYDKNDIGKILRRLLLGYVAQ